MFCSLCVSGDVFYNCCELQQLIVVFISVCFNINNFKFAMPPICTSQIIPEPTTVFPLSHKTKRERALFTLFKNNANKSKTSKDLGISRRSIYDIIKKMEEQGDLKDLSLWPAWARSSPVQSVKIDETGWQRPIMWKTGRDETKRLQSGPQSHCTVK